MQTDRVDAAVRTMVDHSLSVCDDPLFLNMLFECFLLECSDFLIKLRPSGSLEEFLRDKDPMLLFKYYRLHGQYIQAAQHMDRMARTEDDVDISLRIEYFDRAVSSASAACDASVGAATASQFNEIGYNQRNFGNNSLLGLQSQRYSGRGSAGGGGLEEEYLVELEGKREISRFQLMAYEQLHLDYQDLELHRPKGTGMESYSDSQKLSMETLSAVIVRLQKKLVGISDLFNDIAMPYKVSEIFQFFFINHFTYIPCIVFS